jgi:CheY-like chemotaxis protein
MRALLHVEDSDAAAVVFRAAVNEANIPVEIERVSDGDEALRILREQPDRRPDVVFLDLNLPRVGGWQVLMEMRADEGLSTIPVIILSTSSRPADRERAYSLGARHYLTKPVSFEMLVAEVGSAYRKFVA